MLRFHLALVALVGAAGACGDNANECGEGTEERDGVCVGTPATCSDGTILDENGACVLDPNACQDGTVLIGGECRDPATEVTVDVTELAEPNALGIGGEASDTPAGDLVLPAAGAAPIVIKGNLTPHADFDEDGAQEPDYDTYLFDVGGPTLIEVSVDGLGGTAGGFAALTDADALESWIRIGVNTTGDTTKRQLFLPTAGTYALAIADTRTLLGSTAHGGADTSYYASVRVLPLPAPTPIAITNRLGTATGTIGAHEVKLFTTQLDVGLNEVRAMTYQRDVIGALVVNVDDVPVALATEQKGANDVEASYVVGGVDAGDTTIIVLDQEINSGNASSPFRIDVQTRTATALSTGGGSVTAANPILHGSAPTGLDELATFYFDATSAGQLFGLDLAWDAAVDGLMFHEGGGIASVFSWDPFFGSLFGFEAGFGMYTWSGYQGIWRAPAPGRYYLTVFAPGLEPGDPISATSTIAPLVAAPLAFGATGVSTVAHPDFNSVPFEYAGNAQRWQAITVTADLPTSSATATFFDPARATGTLDPVQLTGDWGGETEETVGVMVDTDPLFSVETQAAASATVGRISNGAAQRRLVILRTRTGAGTVSAKIDTRAYTDEGLQTGPFTVTHPTEAVVSGGNRYLLRTQPGSTVTATVTPTAIRDARIQLLGEDETILEETNEAPPGGVETFVTTVGDDGRVALQVLAPSFAPSSGGFSITIAVEAPPAPFYANTAGTTAWTNICATGTEITPFDHDDGLTAPIALPAGFTYFGEAKTQMRVSTNGWLTFDTDTTFDVNAMRAPQRFPSDAPPNDVIAPLWTDLANVRICTQTSGTKLIVQWRGDIFGSNILVATQAILDTADDSIELVYAPFLLANGFDGGGGVENADGTSGTRLFFSSAGATPGTSRKLTPAP